MCHNPNSRFQIRTLPARPFGCQAKILALATCSHCPRRIAFNKGNHFWECAFHRVHLRPFANKFDNVGEGCSESRLVHRNQEASNAAFQRLAHATTNKGHSPASPRQALVGWRVTIHACLLCVETPCAQGKNLAAIATRCSRQEIEHLPESRVPQAVRLGRSAARHGWAVSHRACGYDPSDAAVGGHAPIRCRNATIFPR